MSYSWSTFPRSIKAQAEEYREHLLEAASHADDEMLELVLEGKAVSEEMLRQGAADRHAERQADAGLLRLVEELPRRPAAARRRRAITCRRRWTGRRSRASTPRPRRSRPSASPTPRSRSPAWRSRPSREPTGDLVFVRIYSGELQPKDDVLNTTVGRSRAHRPASIRMMGDRRDSLDVAGPGEIVAVVGLKQTYTGNTLCAADAADRRWKRSASPSR